MVLHVLPGWIPRFGPFGRLGVVRGPSQRPVSGSLGRVSISLTDRRRGMIVLTGYAILLDGVQDALVVDTLG